MRSKSALMTATLAIFGTFVLASTLHAQGAGGPGKSAGIGGTAFEEAEAGSLGYVPPDAGVAPTLDPGLFARYLNALAAIEGRHW